MTIAASFVLLAKLLIAAIGLWLAIAFVFWLLGWVGLIAFSAWEHRPSLRKEIDLWRNK